MQLKNPTEIKQILTPKDVFNIIKPILDAEDIVDREKEHIWTINLNGAQKIISINLVLGYSKKS